MKQVCCAISLSTIGLAAPQTHQIYESTRLADSNPAIWAEQGSETAATGPWMIVGAGLSEFNGSGSSGKISVYRRSNQGYALTQELGPAVPAFSEALGRHCLKASGDLIVASSLEWPLWSAQQGRVHIFRFDGVSWVTDQVIEGPFDPGPPYSFFGSDAAVFGDDLFVGATGLGPQAGGDPTHRGGFVHYKYIQGVWTLTQVWEPGTSAANNQAFGKAVEFDGQTLIVDGHYDTLVFEIDPTSQTWVLAQTINDPIPGFYYASHDIAIDGDWMAIGSKGPASGPTYYGGVAMYQRTLSGWQRTEILEANPGGMLGNQFGTAVDLKGGKLLVGAPGGQAAAGLDFAAAYQYELDGMGNWVQTQQLNPTEFFRVHTFGGSVAIGNGVNLVGDHWYNDGELFPNHLPNGACFAYEMPLGETGCDGVTNSSGSPATIEIKGSPVADENMLRLRAADLPPGLAGMFLTSQTPGFLMNPGGSTGNLCLGGQVLRINGPGQVGMATSSGERELILDTQSFPYGNAGPIHAGETWHFQYWYRDNTPAQTTNFSDSRSMLFE